MNYYTGFEADVIVYANYIVNGKTYKTQLASNIEDVTMYIRYMFNGYIEINCDNIKTITFSNNIDVSNMTNMRFMSYSCFSLTSLEGMSN